MITAEPREPETTRVRPVLRVAGLLLVLLGLANVVLAGVAAATTLIRLPDSTTVVLGLLGLATVVLGVLVARGSRWALVTALVVFGGLFVVQAFAATDGSGAAPAVVTLAVVVAPLAVAAHRTRGDHG